MEPFALRFPQILYWVVRFGQYATLAKTPEKDVIILTHCGALLAAVVIILTYVASVICTANK